MQRRLVQQEGHDQLHQHRPKKILGENLDLPFLPKKKPHRSGANQFFNSFSRIETIVSLLKKDTTSSQALLAPRAIKHPHDRNRSRYELTYQNAHVGSKASTYELYRVERLQSFQRLVSRMGIH